MLCVQIKEPDDYRSWRESIHCELAARQELLVFGPMWRGGRQVGYPMTARVNIAAVSTSTVNRRLSIDAAAVEPVLQMTQLDMLAKKFPGGRFWISMDGTDVTCSLQNSKTGEWNGDVNLGDSEFERVR